MFEAGERKVMAMTLYQVIKNLEKLKDIPAEDFFDAVESAFERYSYEGEDELVGHANWPDLNIDGSYELPVKSDHPDAYELTLYVTATGGRVTVTNVL